MNNKGFAVSGILYALLLMFITILVMLLFNFQNKKNVLDKLKQDTIDEINDTYEPILTINSNIPTSITKGTSYNIVISYSSNATVECLSDKDGKVSNTNELVTIGNHIITCIAKTKKNKQTIATKNITIKEWDKLFKIYVIMNTGDSNDNWSRVDIKNIFNDIITIYICGSNNALYKKNGY